MTTAMILAAGRGERMRPLTDSCPKPLLKVQGKALIDWQVEALARGGFNRLVINTGWLGELLPKHFSAQISDQTSPRRSGSSGSFGSGDGLQAISYSHEADDFGGALETAGGIARALPLLGEVFWVLAADVFMPGFEFSQAAVARFEASNKLAHLWLVPNPAHNPRGDFGLSDQGLALNLPADSAAQRHTFGTIALYRKAFFNTLPFGNPQGLKAPLAPLLRAAMDNQQVSAELYPGAWTDVGTPARLAELNQDITQNATD
jgi:MurNAc alpha-1-phosphate uridylyltransferase